MTLQDLKTLTAAYLPQAHRLITTAAGKGLPIRAKSHRVDHAGMPLQDIEALTAAYLPQAHRLITTAGKGPPIRAKGHRVDPIGVCLKGLQWETTCSMPEPNLTCPCSCRQDISLWTQRHRKNTSKGIGKD